MSRAVKSWCYVIVALAALAAAAPASDAPAVNPRFASEALRFVEDDAPVRNASQNRDEALAYDLLFLHAHRMPNDVLRTAARRDLTFAHLFGPERSKYRGELVHVEGRLRLLRRYDPPESLPDDPDRITDLYEGWVFIEDYGQNPYCVVASVLPEGLKPAEKLDVPVEFDAYFFKRYMYGARDGRRLAPLLIGKTITPKSGLVEASQNVVWAVPGAVVAATFALVGVTAGVGIAIVWWSRRSDRDVRARLEQLRQQGAEFP